MKIFRILHVSIDVYTNILSCSLTSGAPPRTDYKARFPQFSKFWSKFSQNHQENFKKLSKNRKISLVIFNKIESFHWFFKHFLQNIEFEKTRKFLFLQWKSPPPIARGTLPNAKSCMNYWIEHKPWHFLGNRNRTLIL